MVRVGALDDVDAPVGHHISDERRTVSTDMGDRGAPVQSELVGERGHGGFVRPGSGRAPFDHAGRGRAHPMVEVAKLIAEGLTNKQIGARLFISQRTVATHVHNILNKLGFDSRAQIASWMASSTS